MDRFFREFYFVMMMMWFSILRRRIHIRFAYYCLRIIIRIRIFLFFLWHFLTIYYRLLQMLDLLYRFFIHIQGTIVVNVHVDIADVGHDVQVLS